MGTYANGTDRPTFTLEPVHAQRMRELVADEHPLGSQLEWLLDVCNLCAVVDDSMTADEWQQYAITLDIWIDGFLKKGEPLPDLVRQSLQQYGSTADFAVGIVRAGG